MKKPKNKKEKVQYYDDGSTISDMSSLKDSRKSIYKKDPSKPRATEREKLKTFFQAFKMMLLPTFIALLVLLILYIIFSLIGS
ncbi:hypothetical protein J6Y73_00935 [bacterium]|nr:hypothetical protein [bacterium]